MTKQSARAGLWLTLLLGALVLLNYVDRGAIGIATRPAQAKGVVGRLMQAMKGRY